eukprot:11109426-Alexandrium_andersonii.AAC.1
MSASLVGSEMCIRDSPAPTCRSYPSFVAEPVAPMCDRSVRVTVWEAVSYTHLTLPTICSV